MNTDRRKFLHLASGSALAGLGATSLTGCETTQSACCDEPGEIKSNTSTSDALNLPSGARKGNPIAISTYSYWRYREDSKMTIDKCIDHAGETGFDAVEILEVQMEKRDNAYCQMLKQRAMIHGMSLCGMSTHQGFVTPDKAKREENIKKTIASLELAYNLGIPTIRVNTGRWGTSGNFNTLMANRGIEPPLKGYTEEDAFPWVIDSFEKLIPTAEKLGVTMGLENHWGLGLTPEGVLRVVDGVDSPWLQVTVDTGNFLEDPYERLAKLAPRAIFLQAKTYWGGGTWYTLDLDYARIAKIFKEAKFKGFISLEFEGKEHFKTAIPKSLALLRAAFG